VHFNLGRKMTMTGKSMKALVLEEYDKLAFKEVPIPKLESDEVLVRVKSCGICGSDVHGMDGSTGRRRPPIIMGHEASGVIEETGSDVADWKAGDRVTFDSTIYPLEDWYTLKGLYNLSDNRKVLGVSPAEYRRHGALAEFVAVPQHILYLIPDNVSFDEAAMVEPAAVALHAVNLTPVSVNDTALVVGSGMVGLFVVQILRVAGCGTIIAVDLDPGRLSLAEKLGADIMLQPQDSDIPEIVRQATMGRGTDFAIEVVGLSSSIKTAVDSLRRGGTLTLVGNLSPTVELPLQTVVTGQLRLQGSCAICGEYPAVLEMISKGSIDVMAILSATAPLSEGALWFERLYEGESGLMKVILNP
jgi:L-iditol 2-dehydrogenase